MIYGKAIGIALLFGISTAPAYAALITNGSFETASAGSNVPSGNGSQLPAGNTSIAGWTVIGGPGFDGVAWLGNGNTYGVSTPFGSYFLDLTGYNDQAPYFGVQQSINTVVGGSYTLSFDLGVDQGSSLYHGPIGVEASAGSTSQDFQGYDPSGTGNIWQSFSLNFTATSASTTISIQGTQGLQYIGLDNVSVTGGLSAVPLPSSLPLFASAIVVLGAAGYGLKRTRAATSAA